MPTTYLGREILTKEEYETERDAGGFNPAGTYETYLRMIKAQHELKQEAIAEAEREGYELGAPQIELTEEDEEILDRVYAELNRQKEQERLAA